MEKQVKVIKKNILNKITSAGFKTPTLKLLIDNSDLNSDWIKNTRVANFVEKMKSKNKT